MHIAVQVISDSPALVLYLVKKVDCLWFHSPLFSRVSESAFASFRIIERIYLIPLSPYNWGDNQLGNSLALLNRIDLLREVVDHNSNLSAIIRVNRPNGNDYSVVLVKPRAPAYLGLISFRERDKNSRADIPSFSRPDNKGLSGVNEVAPGGIFGLVCWQIAIGLNSDFHIFLNVTCCFG